MPWINPSVTNCGKVSRPSGAEVPSSIVWAPSGSTNPRESPSVPGNGRAPAPLVQAAEPALAVKLYAVAYELATTIFTKKLEVPPAPTPKFTPEAFRSLQ